jgi:hypothetical protein
MKPCHAPNTCSLVPHVVARNVGLPKHPVCVGIAPAKAQAA